MEARHRPCEAEGEGAGECGAGAADPGGDPPESRDRKVVAAVRAGVCRQGMGLHNGRSLSYGNGSEYKKIENKISNELLVICGSR